MDGDQLILEIYKSVIEFLKQDCVDEELKNGMAIWVNHVSMMLKVNSVPELIKILQERILELDGQCSNQSVQ